MIHGQNTLKHRFLTTRAITLSLYLNQEQCHWWLELHCLMALAIWSLGSGSDRVLKRNQNISQRESMNSLCLEVSICINSIFLWFKQVKRMKRRVLVYLKVAAFIMGFQQRQPPLTTSNVSPGMFYTDSVVGAAWQLTQKVEKVECFGLEFGSWWFFWNHVDLKMLLFSGFDGWK